ncbi:30S ribosomal protein S18 [Patescibacteria group bacterium]|nr:30S ribosomal protein S18 [Patescibacteria group bacterium]MBU2633476.1 30S ribosomal protein S18 [Patescibacteria group bacterium]
MAKNCYFCANNMRRIDYKETKNFEQFLDEQAKIIRRKETHFCVKHQKKLTQAIKRARFLALIPFVRQ